MGQCSTLPADKNGKGENGRNTMSPATHSRRAYNQQREERESYHEEDSRRQADGDVVEGLQNFDSSHLAELVHQSTRKDSFSSTVSQVNECSTALVECLVPRFLIVLSLDPLKDEVERSKFDLSVG